MDIAIIGAGIGGLTTALALKEEIYRLKFMKLLKN